MKDLYLSTRLFLAEWRALWAFSVLENWDEVIHPIPKSWLTWAHESNPEEWFTLGLTPAQSRAPLDLREFAQKSPEVRAQIPRHDGSLSLQPCWSSGLTPKKKHEIESILSLIQREPPPCIIDIGGGSGHLARQIARLYGSVVHSIDHDSRLQEAGQRACTNRPWSTHCRDRVHFHLGSFPTEFAETTFSALSLIHRKTLSIGLHTCGALAWRHLEWATKNGVGVLNFGCCYERLNIETDINRSEFCKAHPIAHCEESLHLMTRGGHHQRLSEFEFQQRVLTYRYSFEVVLRHIGYGHRSREVGTAPLALYRGPWSSYARNRLQHLGLGAHSISDAHLKELFHKSKHHVLEQRFLALLRNSLAPALEISLLMDRVFWFEEQTGQKASLIQVFERSISPRNLGLWLENRNAITNGS
jgi:hypothetical protein